LPATLIRWPWLNVPSPLPRKISTKPALWAESL
jgi:hypothetical protein